MLDLHSLAGSAATTTTLVFGVCFAIDRFIAWRLRERLISLSFGRAEFAPPPVSTLSPEQEERARRRRSGWYRELRRRRECRRERHRNEKGGATG